MLTPTDVRARCASARASYVFIWLIRSFILCIHGRVLHSPSMQVSVHDMELPLREGEIVRGADRNGEVAPPSVTARALDDGLIGHWFSTNIRREAAIDEFKDDGGSGSNRTGGHLAELMAERSHRLHHFPLGISPIRTADEHWLLSSSGRREGRPQLLSCCCLSLAYSDRVAKMNALVANGFNCDGGRANASDYLRHLSRAKFVFSPQGHGKANFRDLEAVAMGAIALVDAGAHSPATWAQHTYSDMPILPVVDWRTITPTYLEKTWTAWHAASARDTEHWPPRWPGHNLRALYTPFWLGQLIQLAMPQLGALKVDQKLLRRTGRERNRRSHNSATEVPPG